MKLKKAVIPVAGFGTRMLPAAKAVAKEMLPILDRPTIEYVVEEAAGADITDVLLITGRDKRAIEDHFDINPELEARLRASGREQLLSRLNALIDRVRVHSIRQGEARGLGHAVSRARDFVGNEPFLCMLGDTIFSGEESPASQLAAAFAQLQGAVIGLELVEADKVSRYGIIGGKEIRPGIFQVDQLVEKPAKDAAPSRLAIAARYVLTPGIFECLERTPRGKGGEIQLTDAIQLLLQRERVHGVVLKSKRHDIGNPVDWLKTNLAFAARDPALWRELEPAIRALLR